jgi:hypothetical protein
MVPGGAEPGGRNRSKGLSKAQRSTGDKPGIDPEDVGNPLADDTLFFGFPGFLSTEKNERPQGPTDRTGPGLRGLIG